MKQLIDRAWFQVEAFYQTRLVSNVQKPASNSSWMRILEPLSVGMMLNLDPLMAPVEPPLMVPVLPPLIVPVLPPEMVPTAVVRPPEIVPAEAMVVSDKVNTVANDICLRVFILFLLAKLIAWGHAGGIGLGRLHLIRLKYL